MTHQLLTFAVAVTVLIASFAAAALAVPMVAVWTGQLDLTAAQVAHTVLSYFLGCLFTLLLLARLSNFSGRRPAVLLSLTLSIAAALIMAYTQNVVELYIARFMQGLACGLASSACMAWVVDTSPAKHAGLGAALTASGPNIGLSAGTLVTGIIIYSGILTPEELFEAVAGMLILCVILVLLSAETMPFRTQSLTTVLTPKFALPQRLRRLFILSAAGFIGTWGVGSFYQGFSAYMAGMFFGSADTMSAALVYLMLIVPNAVCGVLAGRFYPARCAALLITLWATAASLAFMSLHFNWLWLFIPATILTGLSSGGTVTACLRLLIQDSTLTERAGIIAVLYFSAYIGSAAPNVFISSLSAFSLNAVTVGFGVWFILAWLGVCGTMLWIRRQPSAAEALRFKIKRTPVA